MARNPDPRPTIRSAAKLRGKRRRDALPVIRPGRLQHTFALLNQREAGLWAPKEAIQLVRDRKHS